MTDRNPKQSVPLTIEELEQQLADQLGFLQRSAGAFDEGIAAEAKRLATTLRVLLHDTKQSKSLLGQLGRMNDKFLSTAAPLVNDSLLTHSGLVAIAAAPQPRYIAVLDDSPFQEWIAFEGWWRQPIFKDSDGRLISRKSLIHFVANNDGGAHVDPALPGNYHDLSRRNSLNWLKGEGPNFEPLGDPAPTAVRQIAHEVLRTLIPNYVKKPTVHGTVFMGVTVEAEPGRPPTTGNTMRRNEQCFCGSGRRFKHCHGKGK